MIKESLGFISTNPRRQIGYQVVVETSIDDLERSILALQAVGWEAIGSMTNREIDGYPRDFMNFYQSMVKYETVQCDHIFEPVDTMPGVTGGTQVAKCSKCGIIPTTEMMK